MHSALSAGRNESGRYGEPCLASYMSLRRRHRARTHSGKERAAMAPLLAAVEPMLCFTPRPHSYMDGSKTDSHVTASVTVRVAPTSSGSFAIPKTQGRFTLICAVVEIKSITDLTPSLPYHSYV